MKWEYKIANIKHGGFGFDKLHIREPEKYNINELGKQEWELVTVIQNPYDDDHNQEYILFFKRPLKEKKTLDE